MNTKTMEIIDAAYGVRILKSLVEQGWKILTRSKKSLNSGTVFWTLTIALLETAEAILIVYSSDCEWKPSQDGKNPKQIHNEEKAKSVIAFAAKVAPRMAEAGMEMPNSEE